MLASFERVYLPFSWWRWNLSNVWFHWGFATSVFRSFSDGCWSWRAGSALAATEKESKLRLSNWTIARSRYRDNHCPRNLVLGLQRFHFSIERHRAAYSSCLLSVFFSEGMRNPARFQQRIYQERVVNNGHSFPSLGWHSDVVIGSDEATVPFPKLMLDIVLRQRILHNCLARFGFLVLVFSGLAYVADPNAFASVAYCQTRTCNDVMTK